MAAGDIHLTASIMSAQDVADAVWAEPVAGHDAAGSFGHAVEHAAALVDPLQEPVPGAYPDGTAGAALGRLRGGPIAVVSPLSRTADLSLIAGDDYLLVDGRQIEVPHVGGDVWPSDLTGWTLTWWARDVRSSREVTSPASAEVPSGAAQVVRVELPAAVTSQLASPPGVQSAWTWGIDAATAGPPARQVTLRTGGLVVGAAG